LQSCATLRINTLKRSRCRSVIDGSCCARQLNSLAREKKAPKPAVATAASAARAEHRQFFVMFLRSSELDGALARMDPEDLAIISALSEVHSPGGSTLCRAQTVILAVSSDRLRN
jgi:hypothetical protein